MNSNIREKYTKNNRVQELEELMNELLEYDKKSDDGQDNVSSKDNNNNLGFI